MPEMEKDNGYPPTYKQKAQHLHAAVLHVAHSTVKQYCHCVPMLSPACAAAFGLWSWGPVRSFPIVGTMEWCERAHSGRDVRSARYDSTLHSWQGGFPPSLHWSPLNEGWSHSDALSDEKGIKSQTQVKSKNNRIQSKISLICVHI